MARVFKYEKHLSSGDTIRLLKILPGPEDHRIRAKIRYRHLTEDRKWHQSLFKETAYNALSYTWGNPFDDEYAAEDWRLYEDRNSSLAIDLEGSLYTVPIGLYLALRKIRKRHENVLLWVDAICIDQSHDEEKSWQIEKMRDIYQNASRVLVWLGVSNGSSDVAIDTLAAGYRYMKRTFELKELGPYESLSALRAARAQASTEQVVTLERILRLGEGADELNPDSPIQAIDDFFHRAYWGRAWCWQEFAVATKITIICGDKVLEEGDLCMENFLEAWDHFTVKAGGQRTRLDHRPWMMMECRSGLQSIRYRKKRGFEDDIIALARGSSYMPPQVIIARQLRAYQETLQKLSVRGLLEESSLASLQVNKEHKDDRLYALKNMATDGAELGITVQCGLPWEKLYTKLALAYVARNDLWFLNYCQATSPDPSPDLPSWVPDWSWGYQGSTVSSHYHPSADHLGRVQQPQQPRTTTSNTRPQLTLRGMIVDEVSWVSTDRQEFPDGVEIVHPRHELQWIKDLVLRCSQNTKRDVWTVLIAGSQSLPLPNELKARATEEEMREQLDTFFDSILDGGDDQWMKSETFPIFETFLLCFLQATEKKRVFQTSGGRLGLAQVGIQEGDRISVFASMETAFVLGPAEGFQENPRYHLKCETFVHGLMNDEGLKARASSLEQDLTLE